MRTIHLLRHAKSSHDDPALPDRERPLAERGRRDAPRMGRHLRKRDVAADLTLCSPAQRTQETLALLRDAGAAVGETRTEESLYDAAAPDLLARLQTLPDHVTSVLVVGHNPSLQELGVLLAASGRRLERLRRKFPTATLATLTADVDRWRELGPEAAELTGFTRPKDLRKT